MMENKINGHKKKLTKPYDIATTMVSWSPDGKLFSIAYWTGDKTKIVLYDEKGKEVKTIPVAKGSAHSPYFWDNDTLLYANVGTLVALDLKAESGQVKKILDGYRFVVSPNKNRLASIAGAANNQFVLKVDALDSDLKVGSTLVEVPVKESYTEMAWSPDSRYLVYSDEGNIWVLNPETGEKKQVVSNMWRTVNLLWASNNEIIFSGIPKDTHINGDYTAYTYSIKLE